MFRVTTLKKLGRVGRDVFYYYYYFFFFFFFFFFKKCDLFCKRHLSRYDHILMFWNNFVYVILYPAQGVTLPAQHLQLTSLSKGQHSLQMTLRKACSDTKMFPPSIWNNSNNDSLDTFGTFIEHVKTKHLSLLSQKQERDKSAYYKYNCDCIL